MGRKPLSSFVFVFFVLGLAGLLRFSQNVRTVQVVGLFVSGVACGVKCRLVAGNASLAIELPDAK